MVTFCGLSISAQTMRPNILFVISDDQSYPYASAYGAELVESTAFDRIAEEGILFTNAFSASPSCSPSRAAILAGRYPWQIKEADTHGSLFPKKYEVLPELLEETGDPRVTANEDVWESYPRLRGQMREFKVPFWVD